MKKLIFGTIIFGFLFINIGISIYKIKTSKAGVNDCMITYVKSNKLKGNLYDLKEYKTFHIDTKDYKEYKKYGEANRCKMKGELGYGYYLIVNSLYCSVVRIIS